MPLDYSKLPTRVDCDKADERIDAELDTYTVRDVNYDAGDRREARTAADVAARLAEANQEVASATAMLAMPGLTDRSRKRAEADLLRARQAKERLEARGQQVGGVDAFLADVDVEQNDAQVAVLTAAKNGIAAHRATLPA